MGSTVSVVFSTKRFAGGKLPLKFWNEDVWPSVEILFEKFSIEQTGGFEIFKTFASIADDDSGLVTAAQCDDYFGGHKTKYTGRIFSRSAIDMGSPENSKGMTFEEFAVAIWNYCSYSALQLARQLFEIYDCTNTGELGRPDIESMYRMMYDRDEHEVWCIDQFPFELDGHIDKLAFIKHCGQKRHLIQPAIVYQRRVRKRVGGVLYWGSVQNARKKIFAIQDNESNTLQEGLRKILLFEDVTRKNKKAAAEAILANQKLRLQKDEEKRQKDWQLLAEAEEKEAEEKRVNRDDWKMKDAWDNYNSALNEFEDDYFTIDDVWARHEARADLFIMLDTAIQESEIYWNLREETNAILAEGTVADHEARLQGYLQKQEGEVHYRYLLIRGVLESLSEVVNLSRQNKLNGKFAQTQKELAIRMALLGVESTDHLQKPKFGKVFLEVEEPIARQYGTEKQFESAAKHAHDTIYDWHKKKVLNEFLIHQEKERNSRLSSDLVTEHNLIEDHGSRLTRWEYVVDNNSKRKVYINIDTLEVIHRNSAICERCDNVFEQSDEKCGKCTAKRSSKNGKLYRPFGYQNICVD